MLTDEQAETFKDDALAAGAYRAEVYRAHAGLGVRVWPTQKHFPMQITDIRGKERKRLIDQIAEEARKT